ncbi:cytochrome ubiquinol oxidase subunit I [Bacillus sp. DNRA2]|uniref:hypothetical protein n=1 Tax=Bacillus sp. DNRA2 TaxID=2723053 RepID=UPI00145E1641|nr:hypothetical protein [Bacillus sp. DNRA2]NMD68830.1 cytochrome ubiquinol oxidase subunit I [Bacillus sp. DNRA2]
MSEVWLLSRLQFAITVLSHFLFVPFFPEEHLNILLVSNNFDGFSLKSVTNTPYW